MAQYLKVLRHSDIFPKHKIEKPKTYTERQTVRAFVFNKNGEVALVTNAIHNLYTLPGGGAESENLEIEIKRECLEEINQEIKILSIVGTTKEFRDRDAKECTTTCFVARAFKESKKDFRTKEEIKNGLRAVWVSEEKLMNIFESQNERVRRGEINFYNTAFNIVRDLEFLKEYFSKLEK